MKSLIYSSNFLINKSAVLSLPSLSLTSSLSTSSTLSNVEKRVIALGLQVPEIPPSPKGSYTQYVKSGNIIYLAGHLPQLPDKLLMEGD